MVPVPQRRSTFFLLEQALDAGPQLLCHLCLPVVGGDKVHGDVPGVDAQEGPLLGLGIYFGGMEQGLGGNTAPVKAGAAYLAVLHDGGFQA